jgi:phenylacetate-CoA ligase
VNRLNSWIYAHAPVWLQNAGISIYGLRYRRERLGGEFDRYVREFSERESWNAARFEEYLAAELRRVLLHAQATVPYYRQRWAAAGIGPDRLRRFHPGDLVRLPLTPKSDLRDRPAEFVSEQAGPLRRLHQYFTSGSTGTPVTIYCTSDDHRRFIAAREARSFRWAGASIRMPRSMIGGRMILPRHDSPPPYYRWNAAERQVYFSGYHISRAHAPNYVEGFNRHRPALLTGYANAHYQLARFMLAGGLRLDYRPSALVLSSEKLTGEMKSTLIAAFGARAYEEFGAVENCVLATECERGRLHVSPDFGIVEIVDESGRPVPPGVPGRMVCTGLLSRTQPLIRYEIGDVASWSTETCPCGRDGLPVLEQIVGRLEDVIVGCNGQVTVRFHGLFINLPNVLEGQVVQEDLGRIRIRVVARDGFSEADAETIRRRVADERLGPMQVEVERVAEIERTERGKFRAVINRLPRDIIERALREHAAAPAR